MRSITKVLRYVVVVFLTTLFIGCGSKDAELNSSKVYVSEQLKIGKIEFSLIEYHQSEIKYHTQSELETIFKEDFFKKLKEKELMTEDLDADLVDIKIEYKRRYVGDETPLKTDSLGYPDYAYKIIVKNNAGSEMLEKDRKNLTFQGGFAMNLQVVAGTLRDKKYEVSFIEVLSNTIVNEIEKLERK